MSKEVFSICLFAHARVFFCISKPSITFCCGLQGMACGRSRWMGPDHSRAATTVSSMVRVQERILTMAATVHVRVSALGKLCTFKWRYWRVGKCHCQWNRSVTRLSGGTWANDPRKASLKNAHQSWMKRICRNCSSVVSRCCRVAHTTCEGGSDKPIVASSRGGEIARSILSSSHVVAPTHPKRRAGRQGRIVQEVRSVCGRPLGHLLHRTKWWRAFHSQSVRSEQSPLTNRRLRLGPLAPETDDT